VGHRQSETQVEDKDENKDEDDLNIGLDRTNGCDCITPMKTKFFAVLTVSIALSALTGCYHDPNEHARMGVPFVKDSVQAKYSNQSVEDVFNAAKAVISKDGTLTSETTRHPSGARVAQGKVNQRDVWVSVEPVETNVTQITIQARTPAGGSDINLVAQLNLEIGLQLKTR